MLLIFFCFTFVGVRSCCFLWRVSMLIEVPKLHWPMEQYRSSPRILSCHRYPVGRLLSFLLRALVFSGHTLQGQTWQDLAIKHSFHQRKFSRFPKLTDRIGFLIIIFNGKKQPKSNFEEKKNLLSKSTMLFHLRIFWAIHGASFKKATKSQT